MRDKINSVKADEGGDLKVDADFKVYHPYGPGPLIPNPRIVAVFSRHIFADLILLTQYKIILKKIP